MRLAAVLMAAVLGVPGLAGAQQPASPPDAFATLALDFCGAAVSAGTESIERLATERGLAAGPWRTAAEATDEFENWARRTLRAGPDKRIRFVFTRPPVGDPPIGAVIDEDARACLVHGTGAGVDTAALSRLRDPSSEWQFVTTIEENGGSIFEWPGIEGGSSASLFHWPYVQGQVTRVLLQHRNLPVPPRVSQEVVAAWVAHVVDVCARGVHERRELTAEDFAPFLTFREMSRQGHPVLESAPGQPAGSVIINGEDSICLITSTGERARAVDAAILALAAERGLPPSDRPRRLRLPKFLIAHPPDLQNGRDAYVSTGVVMGILMATVGDTRR